jgi:RNA polymerase sigma factor (sigma-70 family)
MLTSRAETVLGHLYRTIGSSALAGLPDTELLRHFTAGGAAGEAAFAALLNRHGPSVLRVCRSVLRNTHDAEDAFQATFLVLAAKARSLALRGPLALWLYRVSRRVALQARIVADRRRRYEQRVSRCEAIAGESSESGVAGEVLDSVGRLPDRFRSAVILCDLEGLSYAEAAERLGWTHATLRNRLARGRDRLRTALAKKGLAPVTALAAGAVPPVPRALALATARAAVGVAAGSADEWVSASVIALMNGGLRAMFFTKLKAVGFSVLAAAGLLAGAHGLTARGPGDRPIAGVTAPEPAAARPIASAATDPPVDPRRDQPAPRPQSSAAALSLKLRQPVSLDKEIPGAPLREILGILSEKYDLTFIVNVQAFERGGANANVEDANVRLPKMPNVALHTVLRHLLCQLPGQGTVLVRSDHLEIVPLQDAVSEAYGDVWPIPTGVRVGQPMINLVVDKWPLAAVLTEVAHQSGRNVILDARVTDREKLMVTASLLNAPINTAVRVLAEMVNLRSIQLDNVFFVTTREYAAELQAEEDKQAEMRFRENASPKPPPTPPKGAGLPSP